MKSSSEGHWEFQSAQDVMRFWDDHRSVPSRASERKEHQVERHYLGLYLLALAAERILEYPFSVEQFEKHVSPDFMVRWSTGQTTGLEVTRATEKWFQREVTLAERAYHDNNAAVSGEDSGEILPVAGWTDDVVDELASQEAPKILAPYGYAGDAPEEALCRLLRDAIEKKISKLRSGKYRPASSYELLVFEHASLPASDRKKVLATMHRQVSALQQGEPSFHKTSFILSLDVLYDVGGEGRIITYVEAPNANDIRKFLDRCAYAASASATDAVDSHLKRGKPVYSTDEKGRLIKQTADGRRFEVRLTGTEEEIVKELSRG